MNAELLNNIMKYQLFQQVPDEDFLKILLNCYGIEDIDDSKEFTKTDPSKLY